MIQQTVMPFKLKRTEERITSRSGLAPYQFGTGLALYGEFMKVMGIDELVSRYMPKPGSGNSFEPISYVNPVPRRWYGVKPLSMTLYGGGETPYRRPWLFWPTHIKVFGTGRL